MKHLSIVSNTFVSFTSWLKYNRADDVLVCAIFSTNKQRLDGDSSTSPNYNMITCNPFFFFPFKLKFIYTKSKNEKGPSPPCNSRSCPFNSSWRIISLSLYLWCMFQCTCARHLSKTWGIWIRNIRLHLRGISEERRNTEHNKTDTTTLPFKSIEKK